jgi:hypothetical protein
MTRKLYSPSAGKWVEVEAVEIPGVPTAKPKRPKSHGSLWCRTCGDCDYAK